MTIAEMWGRVVRKDGCWQWDGGHDGRGYGEVRIGQRSFKVHRLTYTAFKGPIPEGLDIDHLCRNKGCCNPVHLEAVTRSENTLRGLGPKRNKDKTHCSKGHPFDADNTYVDKKGHRYCRTRNLHHTHRRRGAAYKSTRRTK